MSAPVDLSHFWHQKLSKDKNYIGSSSFSTDSVEWIKSGHGHALVAKGTEDAATLRVIGRVSDQDCRVTADGYWKEDSRKPIEAVELSFSIENPSLVIPFNEKYAPSLQNFKVLMDKISTTGYKKNGGVVEVPTGMDRMRFKHSIFQRKNDDDTEEEEDDLGLGIEFTIDGWPTSTTDAASALARLKTAGTHDLCYLPAYNSQGDIIPPDAYRKALENAIVQIDFTLEHWKIAKDHADAYKASVVKVSVLEPPRSVVVRSPKKRKPAAKDPDSPSKKRA
ncbi:hypothetical protein PM082_011612 [Marasmius tenuissimus]|nr:hypothetical protein PM082_011612 [Marasmius tenuissimus]